MGVQTRSSVSSSPWSSNTPSKVTLQTAGDESHKLFVLPVNTSKDARFVLLKNPRNGARRRYYFCPSSGIFEITKINAGAHEPRSVLLAPGEDATNFEAVSVGDKLDTATIGSESASVNGAHSLKDSPSEGLVNKSAEIFVVTPFDPIFIVLPLLDQPVSTSRKQSGEGMFRPFDDILDEQVDDDRHLHYVLTNMMFRPTLLSAMNQICDSVDAGDEKMYRLNIQKLYNCILTKAQRVVEMGLPASLEERFVTRTLEVPMLAVKREESTVTSVVEDPNYAPDCLTPDVSDSQLSTASTITSVAISEASSGTSVGMIDHVSANGLCYLQRLRTAMAFITASYLDPALSARLAQADTSPDSKKSPNFRPLDEHLEHLAKLRAEALANRSLSDFSKKRNYDDDEAVEERREKRRKQEEEDKKKKSQESKGVRDLKKVDVSGMKKMSDFFGKRAPTANAKS